MWKVLRWVIAGIIGVAGLAMIAVPFIENYYNDKQVESLLQAVEQGENTFIVPVQQVDAGDTDSWMETDGLGSNVQELYGPEDDSLVILSEDAQSGYDDTGETRNPLLADDGPSVEQPIFSAGDEAIAADEATLKTKQLTALGRIAIARIDSELPIVEGAGKTELHYAVGHVKGTADFGQMGNCVLAGHRNYTYGSMYNRLGEVEVGDDIVITLRDGTRYTYTVYDILTLKPGDPAILKFRIGEYRLSIVTCTPVRVASHRLVVQAHLKIIEEPSSAYVGN